MKLKEVLDKSIQFFKDKKFETPRLDAELLIAHALKLQRMQLYIKYESPLNESEVIEWEVHKFEVDRPMSKANFALEFPANTILFNPDSKQMFVVGDMDSIAERFVPTKILAEDTSSSWAVAWWGLSVAMLTASWLVFRRIWRRRSSA